MKVSQNKQKNTLRYGILAFAAVMLFNPNFGIIDVLPDFIGYICIIYAISKLADTIPQFSDARSAFVKLAVVTFSRYPMWLLVSRITNTYPDQMSLFTVLTLAYAVLEFVFFLPAFRSLFDGFSYLVERYGCDDVAGTSKDTCSSLCQSTVVMLTFKNVMGFLPDLCYLYNHDYTGSVTRFDVNWYIIRPVFVAIASVFALVFGIWWLCRFIPYIRKVSGSSRVASVADECFEREAVALGKKHSFRIVYAALTLIVVGSIFNADLPIDNVDIAPDFVSAVCYAAAIFLIGKRFEYFKIAIGASVAYLVSSVTAFAVSNSFFSEYEYAAIEKNLTAYERYNWVKVTAAIDSAVLVWVIAVLTLMLLCIVRDHTSFFKKDLRKIRNLCIGFGAVGAVNALMSAAYAIVMSMTKTVEANDKYVEGGAVVFPVFENFWFVVFAVGIVWIIYSLILVARLKDGVEEKYIFL